MAEGFLQVYHERIGEAWFCVGITPAGRVAFTSLSKEGLEEALKFGVRRLRGEVFTRPSKASPEAEEVLRVMAKAYQGLGVRRLPPLAWDRLKPFTRKVLRLTLQVPRGYVTSYGRLAKLLNALKASRAVGLALASNPFPLLIPCHRVVRGDLRLGGYSLGVEVKAEILEREGVRLEKGRGGLRVWRGQPFWP
ncbi:MAG: hypothetical protein DRO52_01620 [Candidatus Hecatellales archaeon]|nr:MAG: hypothetical protein DRO52_01620 [Candidatus Hecatellales archaeon]